MVAGAVKKNLRLIFQPAKRPRMDDPRAIALELCPVSMPRLRIFSSARFAGLLRMWRQDARLVPLHFLPRFPTRRRSAARRRLSCHSQILFGTPRRLRVLSCTPHNLAAGIFREIDPAVPQNGENR